MTERAATPETDYDEELVPAAEAAPGTDHLGAGSSASPDDAEETDSEAGPEEYERDMDAECEEDAASPMADEISERLARAEDRYLRLQAEFQNFRRRSERDLLAAWSRAQADLVLGLLEVVDDLERVSALDLSTASVEGIMEGIDLVADKFARALAEAGVEVVDPAGGPFDPNTMEAVMRVATETEEDDDKVAMVLQKGYRLGEVHLVRPAKVGVFKK